MVPNLNDKTENLFLLSNKDINKYINQKINQNKANNNIFHIISENEAFFKKFSFYDILTEKKYNFLVDMEEKKLFLLTKINYFGSAFFGNTVISSPNNLILSQIDPLMILINIIFYTTCLNNIDHYINRDFSDEFLKEKIKNFSITNFNSFIIDDLFSNYLLKIQNNPIYKNNFNSNILCENKLFIESFLRDYFIDNETKIEVITEKNYGKIFCF